MNIFNIAAASGKRYEIGTLHNGNYQYCDRLYQFNYVPDELSGLIAIKTHGNDKLISEEEECLRFTIDEAAEIFILYPDKQPLLPKWLLNFEQTRLKVTRMDSLPSNLKGYFGVYKKCFPKGTVILNGCSPVKMLAEDWYIESAGINYCMYSVCAKPLSNESASCNLNFEIE